MREVLLVTRNFAPASHVSVERAIKLAKYLPEFGWRPTVLTGTRANPGLPEDPSRQGVAVHARHGDVEQQAIRLVGLGRFPPRHAVVGHPVVVPPRPQEGA